MADPTTLSCAEFTDLAAAVALDAAEADDVRRVEEHAAKCPDCARVLEDFRAVAAALGSAMPPVEPPDAVRGRLFDVVATTHRAEQPAQRPRSIRHRRVSPAWLVAAASFLFSLGALTWVAQLNGQVVALQNEAQVARDRASRYDDVVEVLASDKLAIRPLQPASLNLPSRGMVYLDPSSGSGMLMCHNLPPIEQGHAYQVWFVRGNERVSAGLLWPDHYGNGYALIRVPTDLQSFESIGLTDEPGTGSSWPTTPRVIWSRLKESDQ